LLENEALAADATTRGGGLQNALLKVLAGMLGVTFEQLKQRDVARRKRRTQVVVSVSSALTMLFAVLTGFAYRERNRALQARFEAQSLSPYLTLPLQACVAREPTV
jgi:hypothetical protein